MSVGNLVFESSNPGDLGRWSAKSCCHPLRVRQMMLRSVGELRVGLVSPGLFGKNREHF